MAELFNENFSSKDASDTPRILMTKYEPQIRCATCHEPLPLENGYLASIWCEACHGTKMRDSPTDPLTPTIFRALFHCPCGHSWHKEYAAFPGWFPNEMCAKCSVKEAHDDAEQ